ncbi:iron ABC transporter permease [Thiospirochaeta perfilievii]|uniref:Iron ABC transporter permease n=1 Tax=Thiospirochaeta perfilievii TaxID=252967 RepID=A0A5C1QG07_9SPIO|nr:iron ABC transporter permease [Thiospirochaeta perfilievii]QEN06009.1 iron ABC transporter permease [Thiospirochaeta perfilievii]
MKNKNNRSKLLIGLVAILIVILISTTIGYANITVVQTIKILINRVYTIFDVTDFPVNSEINIVFVRLPRILGACLAGMGLTMSGIIFQAILRNPMAEPYILGVSSGAALGAAISIVLSINFVPFFALTGGLLASILVIFIAGNSYNTNRIILYGVSLNFFLSSMLTLIISLNHNKSSDILFWTLGSFSTMNYFKVTLMLLADLIGVILLFYYSRELNIFTMGIPVAKTLGLNVKKYRTLLLAIASIITGVIVSFTGIIGFVGLIIPHLARLFVGSEHKKVISLSLPLGAIFMMICDTLSRSILTNELPVGVITSLVGAPVFVYLLKKRSS